MDRLPIVLALLFVTGSGFAQMRPPARALQGVADPSMVVEDRGSTLEVLPNVRATPHADASGRMIKHRVMSASVSAQINSHQMGVVFNHAMQQQGYISGEIAFKVKGEQAFSGSDALYPGLKKIASPGLYAVNARTPAEFIRVLKRLQGRGDLEWVEPVVIYGPVDSAPGTGLR